MAFQTQLFSLQLQKPIFKLISLLLLLSLFYLLGTFTSNNNPITITTTTTTTRTTTKTKTTAALHNKTNINWNNCSQTKNNLKTTTTLPPKIEILQNQTNSKTLDFTTHHSISTEVPTQTQLTLKPIKQCPRNYTNYCPCQDKERIRRLSTALYFNRERHCPEYEYEKLRCLVPRPPGYRNPFQWPRSKDVAWYKNVPFERLAVDKKAQNWVRLEGDVFVFPGGGTSFRKGVKGYVDGIKKVVDLVSGSVRTALDVGCGVATFGAALLDYNVLTVSIAPLDMHEAQVQFALERGVPAMLGILSTYRLPFPSRSFDLAHCSRCLVNWTDNDGLNLLEIDRVLRPGGYWVLSGPPISWKVSFKGWERSRNDLEKEQIDLENLAIRLCWKKVAEKGPIAVWQKPSNHIHCAQKLKTYKSLHFCEDNDPDSAWYTKMVPCITPLPDVKNIKETSGGSLQKWPKRLNAMPPRISRSTIKAISSSTFSDDNRLWKRRVQHYRGVLTYLFSGGYRNIMDMNAGLGGFASAMSAYPVWVMNVVPFDSENNTLGVIYDRGLIGSYMNWCEAFSTYPRTYDLIHADGVFSMYMRKCDALDILLEMYRILRPHGAVIVRDHVDVIFKVKDIMEKMGWKSKLSHSEHGPFHPQKVLFVDNTEPT